MKYGSRLSVSRYGVTIIVNGFWFSVFKNMNTGRWGVSLTQNMWRKTKTPKPVDLYPKECMMNFIN